MADHGSHDHPDLAADIEARMRVDRVPGLSVAVVRDDSVCWLRGFGRADLASGAPASPTTPYLWFSMTKIVTATAVMCLADEGRVDLDAPVTGYVASFAAVRQPIPVTVRHLLSHSSGLANPLPLRWVYPSEAAAPDPRAFLERVLTRHRRLRFRPGSRAGYSNLGYLVLGEVIAQASGVPYREYVRTRVLAPLGMAHTGFDYSEAAGRPAATGYQRLPAPLTPLLRAVLPGGVVGDRHGPYVAYRPFYVAGAAYGGLVGGVDDVAHLAQLHLNHGVANGTRLLSRETTEAMQRITARGGALDFGLGWFRRHDAGDRPAFVEHLGGGSGFFNVLRLYPDRRLGVVVMGNTTRYDHEAILATVLRTAW